MTFYRAASAVLCVGVVALTACRRQDGEAEAAARPVAAPPAPPAPSVPQRDGSETRPSLRIESRHVFETSDATQLAAWTLQGENVKELTVRLLVCVDGKTTRNDVARYAWRRPTASTRGLLAFTSQDGKPFGADGKRAVALDLSFESGAPTDKSLARGKTLIPSALPFKASVKSQATDLETGEEVLYAEVSAPSEASNRSIDMGSEERVVVASEKGGVSVAVLLSWK